MSLSINNQNLNVMVKELKPGTTLQDAKALLDKAKDGYDTIGFSSGGKDYIAVGQGLQTPKGGILKMDGKECKIDFVEQEANTAGEGAVKALKSAAGLISIGASGLVGAGLGTAGSFLGGVASAIGGGGAAMAGAPIIAGAAILAGVGAGAVAGVGAIQGATKKADSVMINQLAK